MKRLLFEILLIAALAAAGWFAWSQGKLAKTASGKLGELSAQQSGLKDKLEAAEQQLAEQAKALQHMAPRAQQFDAAQGALSGGQVLADLEKLYAGAKKGLSHEQQLGLGVVRLLSKGPQDPGALQALHKTLEQIDWKRNHKIICATQNALAAVGKDVKVLAECSNTVSLADGDGTPPSAPASAPPSTPTTAPQVSASHSANETPASASAPTAPTKAAARDGKKP